MRILLVLVIVFCFFTCKQETIKKTRDFSEVEIQAILIDTAMNIRALELDNSPNFSFAASNGWIGGSSINEFEEIKTQSA